MNHYESIWMVGILLLSSASYSGKQEESARERALCQLTECF